MCNTRWFEILSLYFSDLNILPHFPSSSWFLNKYDMANIHNHKLLILRSRMRNRVTGRLVDLHPCKFCDYKGDCSSNLKEHVLRKHEAVSGKSRPFICPECDLKFKPKRDLKQHERRCRETKQAPAAADHLEAADQANAAADQAPAAADQAQEEGNWTGPCSSWPPRGSWPGPCSSWRGPWPGPGQLPEPCVKGG